MAEILSDKIRRQVEKWRDSYLNSSIKRNNLLNQNPSRAQKGTDAVRLVTDERHTVQDLWEKAADRGGAGSYPFRSGLHVQKESDSIEWEAPGAAKPQDALKKIYSNAVNSVVQRGENPICLTFGQIRWYVQSTSPSDERYGEIIVKSYEGVTREFVSIATPLILVPAKLSCVGDRCWLNPVPADSNEATINPVFMKKFAEEGYKNFPLPSCGQGIDFSADSKEYESFDITAYFETVSAFFAEQFPEFSLDPEYVALDVFDYSRMCMYRDVSQHLDEIVRNPVIRQFFGEDQRRGAELREMDLETSAEIQNGLDAERSFQILESDSSQCEAVERFKNGESFILEGPPGTGKTQTIVNMLAEAAVAGKKVLFVSGKMSALNTVVKKLQLMPGVNIDKHFLLITGDDEAKQNDVSDTYGKLKASYNAPPARVRESDAKGNAANLKFAKNFLESYNRELYSADNSLKMSVYDICGRMLRLGYDGTYIRQSLEPSYLSSLTREELSRLVGRMERMQSLSLSVTRGGRIEDNPWHGFSKGEFDEGDEARLGDISLSIKRAQGNLAAETKKELSADLLDLSFAALECLETMTDRDCDRLLARDIEGDERILEREIERSKKYLPALERYNRYATVFPDLGERDLAGKKIALERCSSLTAADVARLLSGCEKILDIMGRAPVEKEMMLERISLADLDKLIEAMDTAEAAREEKKRLQRDILRFYDEKIFDFDFRPLLSKLRTSWREKLTQNKNPMGFRGKIKKIMELCRDADMDFSIGYVYELLCKIEEIAKCDEVVRTASRSLEKYGLDGGSSFEERTEILDDLLKEYREEKRDVSRGNLVGRFSFKDFVTRKRDDYLSARDALSLFKVERNVAMGELSFLIDDYELLKKESDRLDLDGTLRDIMPSMYRRATTNWGAILEIVRLFEKGEQAKSARRDLLRSRLGDRMSEMRERYCAFYDVGEWFSAPRTGEDMSANAFSSWCDFVTDRDTVRDFVSFSKERESMKGTGAGEFFEEYLRRSRADFPLSEMAARYEISLLYMYQECVVKGTKTLSELAKRSGENLLEKMEQSFIKSDAATVDYNRAYVDMTLSKRITHNSTLHSYLETQTRDKNYSVRKLLKFRKRSIDELAPCLMMSVYSVSKLLPYELYEFDAVIFDEASQIPEEDAVTSIMRTKKQVVIAGDPKQMPAISYFKPKEAESATMGDDEDESYSCASIIDYILASRDNKIRTYTLKTHYRSNHESLIKYSNDNPSLYGGKLVTFPSPKDRGEDFGIWNYCLCDEGGKITSSEGQNEREAQKVAELVKAHFTKYPLPDRTDEAIESYNRDRSLGVIVFGTKQKQKILDIMVRDELLRKVAEYGDNRVFSVTPVDEIQGDEMAYMILSLTYGRNADGAVSSAWGHMNQQPVALYKFNVAVTRAKDNLKFVHSLRAGDIFSMGTRGLDYVAEYLKQFDDSSSTSFKSDKSFDTDFVEAVGKICEEVVGPERVVYNFGASAKSYRVPVSILSPERDRVVLGVMCEEDRGGQGFSLRESVRSCDDVMRSHGWENLYRANIMQWIRNYVHEKEKLVEKLREIA